MAYDPRSGAFLDKPPAQNPKSIDKNTPAQNLGQEFDYQPGYKEPDFAPYFDQPGPVVNAQQDPLLNYFRDKYWWGDGGQQEGESYWEDPWRVARYKNVADSAPGQLPPWLEENREKLDAAYEYMRWANGDAPWYAWRKPAADDPYREFARGIPAPPEDALWPGEERYKQPAPPTEQSPVLDPAAQVQELELGGLTEAEYQALPQWQKLMIGIMGNAKSAGALTGGIAGLAGGPVGVAVGATLGAGLGGLSERSPSLAKYLMYLDYPAEWIERALGTLSIPIEAGVRAAQEGKPLISGMPGQPGPESVASAIAEVLSNLPAAWQAAHLTYDVADIPILGEAQGSIWQLGQAQQTQLGPDQVGGGALLEAFDRINRGEAPEAVYEDIQQRLGFSGQAREFLGHLIIDPLNVVGGFINDILAIGGKISGNDILTIAAMNTRGPVEAAQQYGTMLRATTPVEEIGRMGAVSKWLGGLDSAGNIKAIQQPGEQGLLSRGAGALVTGGPAAAIGFGVGGPLGGLAGAALGGKYGWNRGFNYLFSMTPSARATELVNNGAINLQLLLERAGGDPDTMVAYIKSMGATPTDLARQLSMNSIEAPEGVAVSMALRDFGRNADEMLTAWKATEWQRATLDNIARATGQTSEDVLRALGDERNAEVLLRQFGDAARQSGDEAARAVVQAIDNGEITARSLQEIGKSFLKNGLPYSDEMFRAQLYSAATEHMARWSADWFKVKPDPTFERLGQTVKSAQSLVLLGLNPSYFVNNVINNVVTSAASGVFGLRSMENINGIWRRIGITPERLRAGIGAGEVGEVAQFGPIREAAQAGDTLQAVNEFFKKGSDKVGLFSRLSSTAEQWSSAQAYTAGFLQAWGRMWRRGSGYDAMPTALERALRNIDDGLPDLVNQAIQGGMNRAEVEAALWSGVTRRGVDHWIPDVADAHGIPEAQAREMLLQTGAYDFLQERLKPNATDAEIRRVFGELDDQIENYFDEVTRRNLADDASRVRERVAGEGVQAALEIFDRIEIEESQRWLQNFDEWEAVFEQTAGMDYTQAKMVIRRQKDIEAKKWARFWANKEASYLAVGKGLGIEDLQTQQFVGRLVDNVDNWKEFFTNKNALQDKFFDTLFDSREVRQAMWEDLQRQIDEMYQAHTSTERRLQLEMDDIFAEMFGTQYGAAAGEAARAWRQGGQDIRFEMIEGMRAFRQSLDARYLPADVRRAEWTKFLNDVYRPAIIERMRLNIEGAHEMYRIAMGGEGPTRTPRTQQEGLQGAQLDNAISTTGSIEIQAAGDARKIAAEFNIPTVDNAGRVLPGADRHILNIIKKYGGDDVQGYVRLEEVPNDLVRRAFEKREELKAKNDPDKVARRAFNKWQKDIEEVTGDKIDLPEKPEGEPLPAANLPLGEVERHDNAPPLRAMEEEAWRELVKPILDSLQSRIAGPDAQVPTSVKGADLDPVTMRNLRAYMERVYGQMSDTKLAAVRWGENRRDAALLNYSRRYGVDNTIQSIFPYHFWYTRSALQWALRGIDRPGWLANYARLRDMQERVTAMPGFPSRLRGKMRIPVPFMPAWAGTAVYVDPLHQLFPFEQMVRPFELPFEEKSQQERRAMYLLQEMVANDEITEQDAQAAWADKTGALWQQVITQAQLEVESEISNPFDFMSLISGPSLPVGIAYNLAMGRSGKINQLPVTRAIQSATAWATPGGINIEAPIRKALGLAERGEFWDFYVDRELANMVADGSADLDAAMLAMVERSGPVFEQATSRVGKVQATRFAGSSLWLDFFPEGEQEQRNLQQQFGAAIDSGDPAAVNEFFNEHPEYQARLLMTNWDDPEERMRRFLISEVWKGYGELPDLTRRELTEEFGDIFTTAFLDKETRSYDAIDTDTLAWWAQSMGGTVPEGGLSNSPDVPQMGIDLPGADVTQAYQTFTDERAAKFGDAMQIQSLYYGLPDDQRDQLLDRFPQLEEYWRWRDGQLARNPELIQYVTSEENRLNGAPPEIASLVYQYRYDRATYFPNVFDLQDQYYSLSRAQRRTFLQKNPSLAQYWEWQRAYMAQFPQTIPYIKSTESIAKAVLGDDYQEPVSVDTSQFPSALNRQLMSGDLSPGGKKWLRQYWEQQGRPGGTFESFLSLVVGR